MANKEDEFTFIEVDGPPLDEANAEDRLINKFMKKIQPELAKLGDSGMLEVNKETRKIIATSENGTKTWDLDKELNILREEEKVIH